MGKRREKWSAVTTIGVELIGCRDPSASWPARQTAARKKKPATSVGMTAWEKIKKTQEGRSKDRPLRRRDG